MTLVGRLTKLELFYLMTGSVEALAGCATLATFCATYWGLSPPPPDMVAVAVAGVALLLLWLGCLGVFLGVKRHVVLDARGRQVTSRPSGCSHRAALVGVITIPIAVCAGMAGYGLYQQQPSEDIIVLLTEIEGPEPDAFRVTDTILRNLRSALARVDNTRVEYLPRAVSQAEGSQIARGLGVKPFGARRDATVVIWGWYGSTPTHVQAVLQFELLGKWPDAIDTETGHLWVRPIAQLRSFSLQAELSEEMVYLTAVVMGIVRERAGDYEAADRCFTVALSQPESLATSRWREVVFFQRGSVRQAQGLHEEAIDDFTNALLIEPGLVEARLNRGVEQWVLGANEEAIADYTDIIANECIWVEATAYNNRGIAYAELGEYEQSLSDLDRAIRLDPTMVEPYYNRAGVNLELGRCEEAIADCSRGIRLHPEVSALYNNRGIAYECLAAYEEAISDYDRAIQLDPDSADANLNRGNASFRQGEYDQAVDYYSRAIGLDDSFALAYLYRGIARRFLGRCNEAIADYSEAIRIAPDLADAYYNRGIAYRFIGEHEQAIADFEQYLRLAPAHDDPRRMAEMYIEEMRTRD